MQHTKLKRLVRALKIPQYAAVGILESLWHLTAREAIRGNIGKLLNEDIASGIDWQEQPDGLVDALVTSGWLDVHETERLVVHDWHVHSDDATDNQLARTIQLYANGEMPRMGRLSKSEREHITAQYATLCAQDHTESHKKPLPLPKPLPKPVKKEQVPSRDKREGDPRHVPFKEEIEAYTKAKKVLFAWDASAAKQLALLLSAAPLLDLQVFQKCLYHRAVSTGVTHGEHPRMWLPNILKYQEAPLNEFGKTGAANGNRNSKTGGNLDAASTALAILAEAERASGIVDEVQPSETGSSEPGDLSHLRTGSIEL